jgi:hypothetical protein
MKSPFISTFFVMFVSTAVCIEAESGYSHFDFYAFLGNQMVDETSDRLIGA